MTYKVKNSTITPVGHTLQISEFLPPISSPIFLSLLLSSREGFISSYSGNISP